MSEAAEGLKIDEGEVKLVNRKQGEPVKANRYHLYEDCSTLGETPLLDKVSDREVELLGLRPCSVCQRRMTGGPSITALAEVFESGFITGEQTPEESAWTLLEGLRERGFYIARKRGN